MREAFIFAHMLEELREFSHCCFRKRMLIPEYHETSVLHNFYVYSIYIPKYYILLY